MVDVQKLRIFYDLLTSARDSLRGLAWSMPKNCVAFFTIFNMSARPSAWVGFLRFLICAHDPLRGSCVSKRSLEFVLSSRYGAVRFSCSRNGFWKLSRGLRACFRNPAVAGSIPRWSAAAPAQKLARRTCSWKLGPSLRSTLVHSACTEHK